MTYRLSKNIGGQLLGIAALIALSGISAAYGADLVRAEIPFAFQVAGKTLPPGEYEFQIDRSKDMVEVLGANKGPGALENIITTLAVPAHSNSEDAHIVFDRVGNTYILSEIWRPNAEGVLVHAANGPHEHHVIHVKL